MITIYAFGAGEYEDWVIRGLFLNREDAERAEKEWNGLRFADQSTGVFEITPVDAAGTDALIEKWKDQYDD